MPIGINTINTTVDLSHLYQAQTISIDTASSTSDMQWDTAVSWVPYTASDVSVDAGYGTADSLWTPIATYEPIYYRSIFEDYIPYKFSQGEEREYPDIDIEELMNAMQP